MAVFPSKIHKDAGQYLDAYADQISLALGSLERDEVRAAALCLDNAITSGRSVFSCGNGGSCAIANHLACDYLKGIQTETDLRPRVISLSSNLEVITAIANDIAYDDIFSFQLRTFGNPGDVLVAVSSSGNSPNIVRALSWARENGLRTIAMTGFDGGAAKSLAEVRLHVAADNYGIIEDVHQSLMHLLAQFLRQNHLCDPSHIGQRKF